MTVPAPSSCARVIKTLNAVNQEVTIWCDNQSKVGISIRSVTGTPTFTFYGSIDGLVFTPLAVGAYPSATPPATNVLTASAAGSWEVNVQNYNFIRVQMTSGAGPATVVLTASVDGSYQEAFATSDQVGVSLAHLYPSTTSSGGTNTMVIPAQANRAINLTFLDVELTGAGFGGNAMLRIWDGIVGNGVPLYHSFVPSPVGSVSTQTKINLPTDAEGNVGINATPGNVMTIQLINLGSTFAALNARISYK